MPGFEVRRSIGGVEVKPGAVITHNPQASFRFGIHAVCHSVDPDRWVGRLTFNGATVAETEPLDTYEQAARAAEHVLTERVVAIFAKEL